MKHLVDWGPGFRFFKCEECGSEWKAKSRDCTSPSGETCIKDDCLTFCHPVDYEEHYEWETDGFGNLKNE